NRRNRSTNNKHFGLNCELHFLHGEIPAQVTISCVDWMELINWSGRKASHFCFWFFVSLLTTFSYWLLDLVP
ncbi:hypothetical protein U1Q18_037617, partial [Sarracenia purpurea var. burkii]